MNKLFASILFLSFVIVSQTGCKKYEEGPSISFRSVNQRITNTWKIESITINGVEMVGQPMYSTQVQFWLSDGVYNQTYIDPTSGVGMRQDGTWELQDSKKKILLTLNNITTGQPQSAITYNIIKLFEKSMWLRSVDNSIEIHLMPQS